MMSFKHKINRRFANIILAISMLNQVNTITKEAENHTLNKQISYLNEIIKKEKKSAKKP